MRLEREIAAYDRLLPNLLQMEGKYVVIRGQDLLGTYDTFDAAVSAGYETCFNDPFLRATDCQNAAGL